MAITQNILRKLKHTQRASTMLYGVRGYGSLEAMKLKNGMVKFYYVYGPNEDRKRISLGILEIDFTTIDDAMQLAITTSKAIRNTTIIQSLQQPTEPPQPAPVADCGTFGDMLTMYVKQLEANNKPSYDEVRRTTELHVHKKFPELWNKPANTVTKQDVTKMVKTLIDDDKKNTARKLQAHIKAAFNQAITSSDDASSLSEWSNFVAIKDNPAEKLKPVTNSSNANDRNLSLNELKAYWKRISKDSPFLAFHLMTGAQRQEQLSKVTVSDVDNDDKTFCITDTKGRREKAKLHYVPLIEPAIEAMKQMDNKPFIWSITKGKTGAGYGSINKRLAKIIEAMDKAKELENGSFGLSDIRRTVETRLAAAGVTKDIRAQLQSHGITGVQAKYYDRYEYAKEKREALETLYKLCTE